MGNLSIPIPPTSHASTHCGYPDWLGQFKANILTKKDDSICLKPSFYARKQSVWGPFWPYWGFPMGRLSTSVPPNRHGGTLCGYSDWLVTNPQSRRPEKGVG